MESCQVILPRPFCTTLSTLPSHYVDGWVLQSPPESQGGCEAAQGGRNAPHLWRVINNNDRWRTGFRKWGWSSTCQRFEFWSCLLAGTASVIKNICQHTGQMNDTAQTNYGQGQCGTYELFMKWFGKIKHIYVIIID